MDLSVLRSDLISVKTKAIIAGVGLVLAFLGGVWAHSHFYPATHTTTIVPDTKIVTVEKPTIVTRDIVRVIADPKDKSLIDQLMKENSDLKAQVILLTDTTATNEVKGGGNSTTSTSSSEGTGKGTDNQVPQTFTFKDYQLTASYTGPQFSYLLNQTFKVVSTVGRDHEGKTFSIVKLFQRTPEGDKALDASTQEVVADVLANHLFVSPRLHLGGARLNDSSAGGVVALQWLKWGHSEAPEDVRFGLLTPAAFLSQGSKDFGLIPFQWNVGSAKHVPLITNLWIGPYGNVERTKFGIVLTAQF